MRSLSFRRACALVALVAACEPRVEEPVPPPSSHPVASVPAPSATAASSAPASASPTGTSAAGAAMAPSASAGAQRCIRATPSTAARTAKKGPDPKCPRDPEKIPRSRSAKVVFIEAKSVTVDVEIAENDHDRQRGLMYRTSMADDHGMIFRMGERKNHTFWMHNTCIPLDMLFIDDDGMIVGIEENVPTMDDSTFEVGCPSLYVLELNAGWSRAHGVAAGQKVKLEGVEP